MTTRLRVLVLSAWLLALAGAAWAQNRAVDTDGAIDLQGAVVIPSRLAVLFLFLAMVLLSAAGALLAQRSQARREAREVRERLEAKLAAQQQEIERLRALVGAPDGPAPRHPSPVVPAA